MNPNSLPLHNFVIKLVYETTLSNQQSRSIKDANLKRKGEGILRRMIGLSLTQPSQRCVNLVKIKAQDLKE